MDLSKEIRDLEARGVYINIDFDHYKDGSNCNWSLDILNLKTREVKHRTGSYGDNHEFGDTIECYEAAITFGNWLLEGANAEWFFFNVVETTTPEGYWDYMTHTLIRELGNQILLGLYKDKKEV